MRFKPQVHLPRFITNWFPNAVWRLPNESKTIYLTFDDGPVPVITPWVLNLLKEHEIEATFFVVGDNVARYPDLFVQILEDGHAVGNHTFSHIQGLKCGTVTYIRDVEKANRLIGSNLFRPPHGWLKRLQYHLLSEKYKIIMWDVISCDYNRNITKEEVLNNVLKYTRDGSIITFHDSYKAEAHLRWALPRAIEQLKAEGYQFRKIVFPDEITNYLSPHQERLKRVRDNLRQLRRWA